MENAKCAPVLGVYTQTPQIRRRRIQLRKGCLSLSFYYSPPEREDGWLPASRMINSWLGMNQTAAVGRLIASDDFIGVGTVAAGNAERLPPERMV